jgi:hypothetical protein
VLPAADPQAAPIEAARGEGFFAGAAGNVEAQEKAYQRGRDEGRVLGRREAVAWLRSEDAAKVIKVAGPIVVGDRARARAETIAGAMESHLSASPPHREPDWKAKAAEWLRGSDEAGDTAHTAFVCDSEETDAVWERVDDVLAALADKLAPPTPGGAAILHADTSEDEGGAA